MPKLLKEILLIVAGVVLCFFMISLSGWVHLNHTNQGRWAIASAQKGDFLTEAETFEMFGESADEIFANGLKFTKFVGLPIVAVVVGSFAGLFMKGFVWLKLIVSLIPLHFFNLDDVLLLFAYAALAIIIGFLCSHFIARRSVAEYFAR